VALAEAHPPSISPPLKYRAPLRPQAPPIGADAVIAGEIVKRARCSRIWNRRAVDGASESEDPAEAGRLSGVAACCLRWRNG